MKHYVQQDNALSFDVRAVLYGVLGTDLTQVRALGSGVTVSACEQHCDIRTCMNTLPISYKRHHFPL